MADGLKIAVYVFTGLAIFGFIAGVSDGMNGGNSIATGSIMWIGLIGLAVTVTIRYRKIRQLKKSEPQKSTPI